MRWLAAAYTVFALVTAERRTPPLCPWRQLTGRRCPACGLTTAVAAALGGDLRGATRAHPFGVPAALVVVTLVGCSPRRNNAVSSCRHVSTRRLKSV